MKRKRLMLTLLVCMLITTLTMPIAISVVNNNGTEALQSETSLPIVPMSSSGYSNITEVVSTESTSTSYESSLTVDLDGNVHVAWQDWTDYNGAGGDSDVFYKRYEVGYGWTTTEVVSTESTSTSYDPSLAIDTDGNVHVAWQDLTDYAGSGTDNDIFYKRYEVGSGWTTTEVVSTESTGGSFVPSLTVDYAGDVHVAWHDYTDYAGAGTDDDIFYKRYEVGSGWTTTEVVSTESTLDSFFPSLAVDSGKNIHIAWFEADEVYYRRYETGVGWTTTQVISDKGTGGSYPSLAVASDGNIHIAWMDDTDFIGAGTDWDIFHKWSVAGSGWSAPEVVSTESIGDSERPSLAVDSSGNVHIAWEDLTDYGGAGIDTDIFYKRYEVGSGWTSTDVVFAESTDYSENPSLAVDSSGNVHIAWEDFTDYGGSGADLDILYKQHEFTLPAEPASLRDIVEFPGAAHLRDLSTTAYPPDWETMASSIEVVSTESTDSSTYSSLAVDSSGNVHVAWADSTDYAGSGTDPDIFYEQYEIGSGWTATEVVSTESTGDSIGPSLAVDSSGNVHVAWADSTDYGGSGTDWDIFYRRHDFGSSWASPEVVSTESSGTSANPSLAVDSDGNIHIAWYDETDYAGAGTEWDIFYKRYEVGVGWTTTEVVSTESTGNSEDPSLAVDSSGNIHVTWHDYTDYGGAGTDSDVFYKRYEAGSSWTVTEIVSTESTGNSENPSLAVDSSGNVHIAWDDWSDYDGAGPDADVFYKPYEVGYGWTTTEVVSTESTGNSRGPSLAVDSSGNIHVAWKDLTDYDGAGTDDDVFGKRYEVGYGWTTTEVVSTESTSTAVSPSLVADTDGNIHITWHDATNYEGAGTDFDIFYRWSGSNKYQVLLNMATAVEGFHEIKELMESKGFTFDLTASNVSLVEGGLNYIAFNGSVLSWWSEPDANSICALLVAAMMDDGHSMVFGAYTNILPAELVWPNSYTIVNAMPYSFIRWFYYDTLNDRTVEWSYSWSESNSPPNWFWRIYWKWRNYINEYYGWHTYLSWWWWFWHYTYDKHWHNLGAEFP